MTTGHITWGVAYPEDLAFVTGVSKIYINKLTDIDAAIVEATKLVGEGYLKEELKIIRHVGYMVSEQISLNDIEFYDTDPHNTCLDDIFEDHKQTIY